MDYKKEVQVRLRVESMYVVMTVIDEYTYAAKTASHYATCVCRFNKTEEEFPSKEDYNDYLEEREDISRLHCNIALLPHGDQDVHHPCPVCSIQSHRGNRHQENGSKNTRV